MSAPEPVIVDQALFGYADGHKQIASSFRLPSKDQYQLAAASDLASGASLGFNDSYLTGLPLGESRRYALIRTWSAPEMPRPGCVWSHVLLIDPKLLAAHGNLANFLSLLRRPNSENLGGYGEPVALTNVGHTLAMPDPETAESLIRQYYSGERVMLDSSVPQSILEATVMAVWSQQWPRLRSSFSFRTAHGAERRRSELINYDVQIGSAKENAPKFAREEWVTVGATDAVSRKVSPLRRFLWRYGRDLTSSRNHYRTLVELFLAAANAEELLAREAIQVFEAIPEAGNGEILKRDILGIGATSPSLLPALAPNELLKLIVSPSFSNLATEDKLALRFGSIPSSQVASLADFVERHAGELGHWSSAIDAGLIAAADRQALLAPLPGRIRKLILASRPELIDLDTLAPLSDEALTDLAFSNAHGDAATVVARCAIRRDLGRANEQLFRAMPSEIFLAAIDAARTQELAHSWFRIITSNASMILQTGWPKGVRSTADLAAGLALLRFPKSIKKSAAFWISLLGDASDDAAGEDRVRLHAFLLRATLQSDPSGTAWRLMSLILPELRPVILRGQLPDDVYSMLSSDLPRFSSVAYWDIDKRILMALSYLRLQFLDDEALRALGLNPEGMETVLFGAQEEIDRSKSRPWWRL